MKQAQIKKLLPTVFQRVAGPGTPMMAVLSVMEGMHAPPEETLEQLDSYFDPRRAPDRFVPYLAGWVDLGVLLDVPGNAGSTTSVSLSTGLGRLRELTAMAAELSEWRGTRRGLKLFLQAASGTGGYDVEEHVAGEDGTFRPFHIRITAPKQMAEHRPLIQRIIELEKPAYVTYELEFSGDSFG